MQSTMDAIARAQQAAEHNREQMMQQHTDTPPPPAEPLSPQMQHTMDTIARAQAEVEHYREQLMQQPQDAPAPYEPPVGQQLHDTDPYQAPAPYEPPAGQQTHDTDPYQAPAPYDPPAVHFPPAPEPLSPNMQHTMDTIARAQATVDAAREQAAQAFSGPTDAPPAYEPPPVDSGMDDTTTLTIDDLDDVDDGPLQAPPPYQPPQVHTGDTDFGAGDDGVDPLTGELAPIDPPPTDSMPEIPGIDHGGDGGTGFGGEVDFGPQFLGGDDGGSLPPPEEAGGTPSPSDPGMC
jgi:hypothetical protein